MSRRKIKGLPTSADYYIAQARLVFLCPDDERHELGRLLATDRETFPEVGKVEGGYWSDGDGHVVSQGVGIRVLADSESSVPLGIEACCPTCGSSKRPRLSWGSAVAQLEAVRESGAQEKRVAMKW